MVKKIKLMGEQQLACELKFQEPEGVCLQESEKRLFCSERARGQTGKSIRKKREGK